MRPTTQKLFTSLLMGALLIAMVANSALAAGRAASHAGGAVRAAPPCHHVDADALAPLAADPCDTLCAGSAPEVTLEHPPSPDLFIAASVVAAVEVPASGRAAFVPRPAPRHPPPTPPYQRDRRLLI